MSCMEHKCTECDWREFDNKPPEYWPYCPKCWGKVIHQFDEQLNHERENVREQADHF